MGRATARGWDGGPRRCGSEGRQNRKQLSKVPRRPRTGVGQVPAGDAFSQHQHDEIVRALRLARQESQLPVSVYVGMLEGESRPAALRLHGALPDPGTSVLVAVDPGGRRLEIVTGAVVRRRVDDRTCGLAALSMTSAFEAGDLAGGIVSGIGLLAEHAH